MFRGPARIARSVALTLASVTWLAGPVFAQSPATPTDRAENTATAGAARPRDLESEVNTLKAENAVVRELLRKMEEQQKALLEQVDRLQRRLDGATTALVQSGGQPQLANVPGPPAREASVPGPTASAGSASAQPASVATPARDDHYQDGMVIWQNPEGAKVPFLLRFNVNTQIRYLNTTDSPESFTDHLGNVREVHTRNDITVNRSMFILAGYVFNPKLQYSLTVWTSAGAASIIVAGNIGW